MSYDWMRKVTVRYMDDKQIFELSYRSREEREPREADWCKTPEEVIEALTEFFEQELEEVPEPDEG